MTDAEGAGGAGATDVGTRPWPRVSRLRIAGPVLLIVAALVAAGITATVNEHNNTSNSNTSTTNASSAAHSTVPITYAAAAHTGRANDYDWGPQCDHATGRLKMPTVYSPPCVPVSTGSDNGGGTSSGVSGNAINIVYFQAQPGGLASAISERGGHERAVVCHRTGLRRHVQPRLRDVRPPREPDPIHRQRCGHRPRRRPRRCRDGGQQLHAFASIGGYAETTAYEDELARLHVLCLACGDSALYGQISRTAPVSVGQSSDGGHARSTRPSTTSCQAERQGCVWAGSPPSTTKKRSFIVVSETSEPPSPGGGQLDHPGSRPGTARPATSTWPRPPRSTYTLNLTTLPSDATTIAEKLKTSGATGVSCTRATRSCRST